MALLTNYFPQLTPTQLQQFEALQPLYAEWNEKINVISRKDINNFYMHHVLHSLSIAALFDFPAGYEIMDLGTGGGFPGIPLAIFFPAVHFHLVDSINKKLKVVEAVAKHAGLNNVTTRHTRAEDTQNRKFDVGVSRAVAPISDLARWSKLLLKTKPAAGKQAAGLICLKGGDLTEEIAKSSTRPRVWEIEKIFKEPFFKEKYVLQVTSSR